MPTVARPPGRPLGVMQRAGDLVSENGQADDENDREEHDANEVVDQAFSACVLPHAV